MHVNALKVLSDSKQLLLNIEGKVEALRFESAGCNSVVTALSYLQAYQPGHNRLLLSTICLVISLCS